MLAGVWVSNQAGSGSDSSGSSRSRLLSSTGGRSRAPGSARRSAGSSSFGILGAPGCPRPPQLREPVQASPSTFQLDPPCPSSPGRAPPASSRCRPPPSGPPRAPSPPQGPGSPSPLHGTAGTGAAEPGSSCLLFRVGWRDPAPRSCRAGRELLRLVQQSCTRVLPPSTDEETEAQEQGGAGGGSQLPLLSGKLVPRVRAGRGSAPACRVPYPGPCPQAALGVLLRNILRGTLWEDAGRVHSPALIATTVTSQV
ncbi:unnamed protein product [Rangifer tarandus platyrhynchus]|uniref:Uncharacterized protein n=2 Tax=Rangifer tarandus platyrhynchus TaxID=3082113 RepID=A0ABN8YRT0_RANTA|nr:unnamed protein product [Rangifer tarandus platyrhynchus]CAI9701050.1 unnamed protein product [Rangifer tarandus platyrhynchus]